METLVLLVVTFVMALYISPMVFWFSDRPSLLGLKRWWGTLLIYYALITYPVAKVVVWLNSLEG